MESAMISQLHARAGREGLGQPLLDQRSAAIARAIGLDHLGILGEPRSQGLGVSLVVLLNEGAIGRANRLFLRRCLPLRLAAGCPVPEPPASSSWATAEPDAAQNQDCPRKVVLSLSCTCKEEEMLFHGR